MGLTETLTKTESETEEKTPIATLTAYNRIDGLGGSSLDLRECQEALASDRPRTIGITIDSGTIVRAYPIEKGKLGVKSDDFGFDHELKIDDIYPRNESQLSQQERGYWLLNIMKFFVPFGLDGVKFRLTNTNSGVKSAGLGGSATATTGVASLANYLTGRIVEDEALIGLASLLEQDSGVSRTGTQEQSNVVFGGVMDYEWTLWRGYGSSVRTILLREKDYPELESRIALYFTNERSSTDVNSVWLTKLQTQEGYKHYRRFCELAHEAVAALIRRDWEALTPPIRRYQETRTHLCSAYMSEACWDIESICRKNGAISHPLGAGGGGTVMVYSYDPENLTRIKEELSRKYKLIPFNILPKGHEFSLIK